MPKAASDVMQSIIFAAVVDAVEALKASSGGVPNAMLRDLQSLHRNSAFADLPKAVQDSIGLSVRPASILGANVTGRIAGMQWQDTREDFALRELNTTGSVFLGSVELQAGWHWMKIGNSPAFGGPVMGVRLHF